MSDEILSDIKKTIIETIINEPDNPIAVETAKALGSIKPKPKGKTLEQLQAEAQQREAEREQQRLQEEQKRQEQIRFDLKLQGRAYRCSSGDAKDCVANEVYSITRFNVPMCKACFEHWNIKYNDRP